MVFSSLIFLCIFFPLQMIVYKCCKSTEAKNSSLIIFSLVFYAWGEPAFILALLFLSFFDWLISKYIEKTRGTSRCKPLLVFAVIVNIGMLAFFKYAVFVMVNLQGLTGFPSVIPNIALPIGISFYTFQLLSYVIDVYRGEVPAQPKYRRLLLYVSLFHQCIAGPIVRYQDVCEQIMDRHVSSADFRNGINRFCVGLAKKVLLANICGKLASDILLDGTAANQAANMPQLLNTPALSLWIGCIAYAFQIYLDFSAYSDMAIGMGLMVGFRYKENFNHPYVAKGISDFWRRWHMSLSTFFRDYVYIPLGGNRKGNGRTAINLLIVWFLTGMWHGAGWNFILWGLYYFIFLSIEKFILKDFFQKIPSIFSRTYTLLVVLFGWVLFYFTDLTQAWTVVKGMFCANGNAFTNFETTNMLRNNMFFLLVAVLACTPLPMKLYRKFTSSTLILLRPIAAISEWALPVASIFVSISFLVSDTYNPFLYLQF